MPFGLSVHQTILMAKSHLEETIIFPETPVRETSSFHCALPTDGSNLEMKEEEEKKKPK